MQSGGEEVSIEELASNLSTYREQLQQVQNCSFTASNFKASL